MNELEAAKQIVHHCLDVTLGEEKITPVKLSNIRRSRVKHEINAVEVGQILRLQDVQELYDVSVSGQLS